MLGFGLFGSASSSFIRHRAAKQEGLFVADLIGVVIRGSSAAVVVFLAVEGGLSIFATGSSEPNPYVLLLTCLVAAVFSEKVWDWAQEQLLPRKLSEDTIAHGTQQDLGSEPKTDPADKPEPPSVS
jgi:hypothetical protein